MRAHVHDVQPGPVSRYPHKRMQAQGVHVQSASVLQLGETRVPPPKHSLRGGTGLR